MHVFKFAAGTTLLSFGFAAVALAHPHPKSSADKPEVKSEKRVKVKVKKVTEGSESSDVIASMVSEEDAEPAQKPRTMKRRDTGRYIIDTDKDEAHSGKRIKIMRAGPGDTPLDFDDNGEKTIMLTGETLVKVGPDGSVVIMNGDEVIEAAGFSAAMQGRADAEFTDNGEAAEISVEKTISQDSDGRRIRVVIEMETDAE